MRASNVSMDRAIAWRRYFPDGRTFGLVDECDRGGNVVKTRYYAKDRSVDFCEIREVEKEEFFVLN